MNMNNKKKKNPHNYKIFSIAIVVSVKTFHFYLILLTGVLHGVRDAVQDGADLAQIHIGQI